MTVEEITKRIYNIFGNECLSEDAHKCEYDGNCKEHELNKTIELMKEYAEQIRADAIYKFIDKFKKRTQLRQMTKEECINTMYVLADEVKEQK